MKLPISFPVLLWYGLVDMRVDLGTFFILILGYLVSEKDLLLSENKLENLFFFHLLNIIPWCNQEIFTAGYFWKSSSDNSIKIVSQKNITAL